MKDRKERSIFGYLAAAVNVYSSHGFEVQVIDADLEFECIRNEFPFSCIPVAIVEAAVDEATSILNRLPRKKGISKHLSPLLIVTGAPKIDFNLLRLSFGSYVEVYEDNGYQTNSNHTRGAPAITLNSTLNSSGSYFFFSLVT